MTLTDKYSQMTKSYHSYIPSNQLDNAWGLYATGIGYTEVKQYSKYPPVEHPSGYHFDYEQGRSLDEYAIIYITQGSGFFCDESSEQKVNQGDIILLWPGKWHSYKPSQDTGWTEHWIQFSGSSADAFMGSNFFPKDKPVISIGLNPAMLELFNQIHHSISDSQGRNKHTLAANIMQIAATLHHETRKNVSKSKELDIVQAASYEIQNAQRLKVDFEQLSEKLNISYSHFRKIFKQQSGLSPYKYLQEVRMKRVKNLLNNTTQAIGVIADITGFDNAYHLSNYFKDKIGCSPREWRNKFKLSQSGNN